MTELTREERAELTPEERAKAMIKAVYDDGEAEINGRIYVFHKMLHKQRRKVFAFYTQVAPAVQRNDFSFLDSSGFEPVEAVINAAVTFGGSSLVKIGNEHWDVYPEDYVTFIGTALAVISYPFLPADATS